MSDELELRFESDTDGTGELFVRARCGAFSGAASAWFSESEIQAFGERLRDSFPLAPGAELRLEGGYWASGAAPPRLEQVLVGIRIYPLGSTGVVGIQLELAEGLHEGQRPASRPRACFELKTGYEQLRILGAQIRQLVQSPGAVVELESEVLS